MSTIQKLQSFLDGAKVAPEIFRLRPDYRASLLAVSGIQPGASDDTTEVMLKEAEASVQAETTRHPVTEFPHISAWREAYKGFGAKPNKSRNSVEALSRRVDTTGKGGGLPRVNRLTDIYNAISVKHRIPVGGEDLDKYSGPARLIRSVAGQEKFEVKSGGEVVIEHPDAGEVVWCDDYGVTCRRWNWRQGPRTALSDETTNAFFILDALNPLTDDELNAAADELVEALTRLGPEVQVVRRLIKNASSVS